MNETQNHKLQSNMNKIKLPSSIMAGIVAGLMLSGGAAQAQSSIANIYPNGTNMFQPASALTFSASSPVGVTNVTVGLTITSLQTGQSFLKNLTLANGLATNGPATDLNVSAALTSNTLYSAVIQIKDANGNVASQTITFDTIIPAYTWEAEDWDFTSNGVTGQFIANPQTNAYAGLLTTDYVDAHNANGPSPYRIGGDAGGGGLATEFVDVPESQYLRVQYLGTGNVNRDYDVGYTDGGDFGNYTRNYPAGTYNIYVRASGGNGVQAESADISVVGGNASITSDGSSPYKFGVKGRGWQSFDFMPVTDSAGNLAQVTFDGNPATLQVMQVSASDNMNFFMLLPLNTNVLASTVTITNVSPDGSALFNADGTFSFTAASASAPVDQANFDVQVTSTNLWGQGSVMDLTAGNGLTFSGPATNYTVSFPTTSNTIYSVLIQITDVNGTPTSSSVAFDTIVPTYTFEAEDFDWGGGQFIDNPQTNAYRGLDGYAEIDYHCTQHGGDYNRVGLTTENLNEKLRPQYDSTGMQDYDVGFNDGGNWGNYTRHYPAGTYNIYVRVSNGTGNSTADSGSLSLVDWTDAGQTLTQLGKFGVPATSGWGSYTWVPVKDAAGNLAQFTSDGSTNTLRMTIDGGNCNENFFLLTPADPNSTLQPYVDNFQPNGTVIFQPSNQVSFVVHSQPGTDTGNIGLTLNGIPVTGLAFSGTANLRTVTCTVKTNMFYTAVITVTDSHGTAVSTNSFSTFSADNYQLEAEDYDYTLGDTSGQFFDGMVGYYAGQGGASGIDMFESDLNGPGRGNVYRAANGVDFPDAVAGDQARDQFTSSGATDYLLGSFGGGSWANYTRHYPAGTYNVAGRFAEGAAGGASASLSLLTSGYALTNQAVSLLGTFNIPTIGWSSWEWQMMTDASGRLAQVTLDGSQTTLQLGGLSGNEVNVNFLMLIPTIPSPKLTAAVNGGNITVSFPTQTGYSYQLQYKDHLTDANWISLGSPISGNGSVQSGTDAATGSARFYQVQVQ